MNWNEVEEFCSDCIMKDVCFCPCEDIALYMRLHG